MADVTFRGDALATAQVTHLAVSGTWVQGDTLTCDVNSKTFTVTLGTSVAIADVIAAVVAAWNGTVQPADATSDRTGASIPEMSQILASAGTAEVILTASNAGTPFIVLVSDTSTGGTFGPVTTPTASTGPTTLDASNISSGVLPTATDNLTFENTSTNLEHGLKAVAMVDVLRFKANYTGSVGLPRNNQNEGAAYVEYRDTHFTIEANTCHIGGGGGTGSQRLKLDLGTKAVTIHASISGSSIDANLRPIQMKMNHVSSILNASGNASIDIAAGDADVAVLNAVNTTDGANVRINRGTTVTTVTASGNSQVDVYGTGTLETVSATNAANVTIRGTAAITNIYAFGDSIIQLVESGVITLLEMGGRAILDASALVTPVTITTIKCEEGATIEDPNKMLIITNPINMGAGNLENMNFNFGEPRTVQVV